MTALMIGGVLFVLGASIYVHVKAKPKPVDDGFSFAAVAKLPAPDSARIPTTYVLSMAAESRLVTV